MRTKLNPIVKQYKLLSVTIIIILFGLLTSCGKSDGNTNDIFIPNIDGNWFNQSDGNDQFSFFGANGAATGSFDGNEFTSGVQIATLTGTFTHSKINFTITYLNVAIPARTYTGTISGTDKQVMTLSSPGKNITLSKQ